MSNQEFQKPEAEYVREIRELRAELEQLKQTNAKLTNSVVETHNLIEANVKLEAELCSVQDALKFQGMKADSLETKLEQTMADAKAMADALAFYVDEKHEVEVDIFVDADDSHDEAGFYRMIDNGDKARETLTPEIREKYLNATKGKK